MNKKVKLLNPKKILPPQDKVDNAVMVHLSRPLDFIASDKIYMDSVLTLHPDLAEFIYEHVCDPVSNTENLVMASFIFEYKAVNECLLKDCKFEVVQFVDRHGKKMNLQEHTAQLMAKVTKDAIRQEDL